MKSISVGNLSGYHGIEYRASVERARGNVGFRVSTL